MEIVGFAEQTTVFAEDQPEYLSLPAHRFKGDPHGRIACCWRLSWGERFRILLSGVLWQQVLTFNQPLQPQKLTTDKPDMPANSNYGT